MKNIQIITNFNLPWVEYLKEVFKDWSINIYPAVRRDDITDVILFAWCDQYTIDFINNTEKKCKYIVFVRAYEYVEYNIRSVDWKKVDRVLCVNDFIAEYVEAVSGIKPEVIYNGLDPNKWTFRNRERGNKIAMVSFIHYKKNHSLAMQIMVKLPKDYELHLAGDVQCLDVIYYLQNLGKELGIEVYFHGQVPADKMDEWLDDKNYILSTSMREGCPNNILEAMAKGIKPIIHNWPGARKQFNNYVFNTVNEGVERITEHAYYSLAYRNMIEQKFSMKNYYRIKEIAEELLNA